MRVQRLIRHVLSLTTLAGAVAAGCAPPSPNDPDENADSLHAAEQSGLLGTWRRESTGFRDPDFVFLGLGPDGRFFGRFLAKCAGPPDPVRSHLRGSYQILPNGDLSLATDLGDAGPLPADCRASLLAALSGVFTVKEGSNELVLEKTIGGKAQRYHFGRVDSYCMQAEDCAIVATPRDDCELSFACNQLGNRCSTACTPPIQPGTLRVRIPSPLPADGLTQVPIFVDTLDPALEQSPFVLTLSRPNAGKLAWDHVRIGKTGFLAGYRTGINMTTYFLPCDAAADPSCVGPLTLTLTLEGHSEPLAQTTVDLVPKSEDLPGTACLVGRNIMDLNHLWKVSISTVAPVHSTHVAGRFTGSMGLNNGTEFAHVDFHSTYNSSARIDILGHGIAPGLYDISVGADTPAQGITFDGSSNSSAFPRPSKGRVRIVELVSTDPTVKSAPIARATIAWEFTHQLGENPVRFSGCAHYDRDTPPFDCGDGVLQQGEECDDGNNLDHDGCSAACRNEPAEAPSPPPESSAPPSSWTCDPAFYDEGDGAYTYCDCDCGAPDPDCKLDAPVFGCDVGQTCDSAGKCH